MKTYINRATTILLMLSCMTSLVFVNTEGSSATTIIIRSCLSEVVPDEHGGAFVVIRDSENDKIMIQHLDSTGNFLWEGSGTIMPYNTSWHKSTYDGQGGVIHVWAGDVNNIQGLYAQRIDNSGNSMWEGSGVLVHKREGGQWPGWLASFTTTPDGDGGAILIWQRLENPNPIYAQRIDSSGKITWDINGVLVAQNTYRYHDLSCISDGMGGAIVAWQE